MRNEDGTVCAVFNGEIYNHAALRSALAGSHGLASNCDSDLIVHLYENNRKDLTAMHSDIHGMYAIAIYDTQDGKCALLRDPVGKKPLYVLESDDLIAFASEMKGFGRPHELGTFGRSPKIWELKPGETAMFHERTIDRIIPTPQWRTPRSIAITDMGEAASQLRRHVEQAVKIRMPEDLSVAILCSGGIDSMIVAYLAKVFSHQKNSKLKAYVIGASTSLDVHAATTACEMLEIPIDVVPVNEASLPSIVAEVVYHTESFEPNIVRNSLLSYLLFKHIRNDDYRVALCGEGADELFFGYGDFESALAPEQLMADLLDDLHRTQLLRVDRTSMAFNVETRAPFLDRHVVDLGCAIAPELKRTHIYRQWQGKAVLRQAFKDVLPWETIVRTKATLSYGAGLGDVSMSSQNPLEQYALKVLGQEEKLRLTKAYPRIDISTFERALYLYYFEQFYPVPADYIPPVVATQEIRDPNYRAGAS